MVKAMRNISSLFLIFILIFLSQTSDAKPIEHPVKKFEDIHWEKMDLTEVEKFVVLFQDRLKTLADAEAVFGPIQVRQEWRGFPKKKFPGITYIQLEINTDSKDKLLDGISVNLSQRFPASLQAIKKQFGKYKALPQLHYDSPTSYLIQLRNPKHYHMIISVQYPSKGDDLRVEQIIVRRQGSALGVPAAITR